ncbi:MAG: lytic transglycosylase domain-containing protein [Herminiimonas sp.]|nr:lytic transglycosylase domain-containing protein [Herminiimonas sp.]
MSLRQSRCLPVLTLLAAMLAAPAARADVYGYIDADGMAHFSPVKIDERYQLFVRGDQQFDSAQFTATPAAPIAIAAGRRSPLFLYLMQHPNLMKYEALLNQAAQDFSLEPALLKAIMAAESGFNPAAVSPKGAVGLMQVMPSTAARYGVAADAKKTIGQKLADPKTNIRLAARYLRDLRQLFPNKPDLVIASYNAGEGAVQKYRNTIPPYPETRNYVQLVMQFYQVYRPPAVVASVPVPASFGGRRVQMTIPGRGNMPAPAENLTGTP